MRNVEKFKKEILESRLLFLLIVLGIIANLATAPLDINVSINDRILFITFLALIWYAWETRKLKEEAIKQTEIEQKPVMMLYVRNLSNITDKMKKIFKGGYTIISNRTSYYLSLRNVGRGPAFNVKVVEARGRNSIFVVEKYQCRFFAPNGDEQAIKFIKKDNSKIENYNKLENIIFEISCEGVDGRLHEFQYKIIDIEKQEVQFINKNGSNQNSTI